MQSLSFPAMSFLPASTAAADAGSQYQVAVTQSAYGDAGSALSLNAAWPRATPSASQVVIRVVAAGMNPADVRIVEGEFSGFFGLMFPQVPGFDCSGVVVECGSAVTRFRCGDAVYACFRIQSAGAFQQYVAVDEALVSLKPANMTFVDTAALPVASSTALTAMEQAGLTSGSRVLVIGASGGCGSYAVQIAKAMGAAYVVGVTSTSNVCLVAELGADLVIDYTQKPIRESGLADMDVIFDTVGGHWEECASLLSAKGKFISTAFWEAPPASSAQYSAFVLSPSHTLLDRITAFVEADLVRTVIDCRFPFTTQGVHSMYAYCKKGRTRGKAVLIVDPRHI